MAVTLLVGGFGVGLDALGFFPIPGIVKLAGCELAIVMAVSHIAYRAGFERGAESAEETPEGE